MEARPTFIASVQRALHLIDAVGDSDRPVPAKMLARRTGQALPTTYHLLRTLVHEGYLRRINGAGYVLGDRVGALAASRAATRAARFRPILQSLHDELSAAAYLSILDDGEIKLVDVVDSPKAPRVDLWVGFHDAAHATALGKAVLASLDEDERRDYVSTHDLPDLTPRTMTSKQRLLRELDEPRTYALDQEEYALGTECVAAAVPSTSITAAIAVSVPAGQVQRVLERSDLLRRAARLTALAAAD
ncbi:MAG: helix-turn-helix domain-containing protein [Streptosporangiales bacterium]|nr:helix-turn-helix domain-containing protein [Streptosporangiales bacterium]